MSGFLCWWKSQHDSSHRMENLSASQLPAVLVRVLLGGFSFAAVLQLPHVHSPASLPKVLWT
jgi:hypothetical protein